LEPIGGTIILNIHDSFDTSVDDPVAAFKEMQSVATALPCRVPLILELNGSGSNWWEAIRKPDK
jgi:hypothetical protein